MRSAPVLLVAAALALAGPARAQLLGGAGLPSLPTLPRVETPRTDLPERPRVRERLRETQKALPKPPQAVEGVVDTLELVETRITEVRRLAAERLLREHPDLIEPDDRGQAVVRGEVLALSPTPAALDRLRQAGFSVRSSESLDGLGLTTAVISVPRGMSAVDAVRRLKALDPEGAYEFNHLYQESGLVAGAALATAPAATGEGRGVRIGLLDGSVAPHPALAGARLVQRAFAPGGAKTSAHATAVASLMVGQRGPFRGAAPGATLLVADVYGPTPAGGSAQAIARGLAWLAESRAPVINVSLVGPPNAVLAAAVRALTARGHLVVAAVGNDGPAAPPLYPAAYPGVVAVTGVDAGRRVLPEAGRGRHVDFAAPGAQMAAGGLGGGYVNVRGTSFAAPLAAGRLAALLPAPDPAAAQRAVAALARQAADAGASGPDPVYGRGVVAFELRTDPQAVGARGYAQRGR